MPPHLPHIRQLDPRAKCGKRTTVELLYRVDEAIADGIITHLVFKDRHGWYCQHGVSCAAVAIVRRRIERIEAARRKSATKGRVAATEKR